MSAGGLVASAAGVIAHKGSGKNRGQTIDQRVGKVLRGSSRAHTAGSDPAPTCIRQSRAMIIVRLEQELRLVEQKLDLTIESVQSPNGPEGVQARKTVESLSALLTRIDVALVAAVDEFPTIFNFTARKSDRAKAATSPQDGSRQPRSSFRSHARIRPAAREEDR
jgi:hypothetical protein